MNAQVEHPGHPIIARLVATLGAGNVLLDPADREFYSTDVYAAGKLPLAVARPATTEEAAEIVRLAAQHGLSVVPRGGGASYTDGYAPTQPDAILVDTGRMNRILEINERDMYVVAQAGVTWAALHDALKERGLRTPFFGPFSGIAATLGGSLSQNSVSWGSGIWGTSGENVLAVEAVVGSGQVVRTGSWGAANSVPFFRSYGPDLTGLFMGDCGAFGIKTAVAMRLMPRPAHMLGLSFGFPTFETMAAGMEAAAREGLNTINFGLDPRLQQGQLGKADAATGIAAAKAVFASSRNAFDGVKQLMKMAVAGRGFLDGAVFSAHWIVEGIDDAHVRSAAGRLREVIGPHGAEVAATIPTVAYAMPFMPLHNVRGPKGERWVPVHGILPFSRVVPFRHAILKFYEGYAERMKAVNLDQGAMFSTMGTNSFLYEPAFYWTDVETISHRRMIPADYLQTLPKYPDNPAGRALMQEIKLGLADLFQQHGAVHLQVGKFYPYMRGREAGAAELVRGIKGIIDPQNRLNPGALGL